MGEGFMSILTIINLGDFKLKITNNLYKVIRGQGGELAISIKFAYILNIKST